MDGLDIGTLSGRIEFEDHVTTMLDLVGGKVTKLEEQFGSLGGRVAESAAGFGIAELAIEGTHKALELLSDTFKDLTIDGAGIADIEDNFDHLTEGAGRLGATLIGALREGTHATIDDLELIKLANQDLSAGMALTDEQFKQLADGAFALAQATGVDVKDALDTMNDAMLTGRTRSLQMLTGKIDLTAAEDAYAAKLGTTADKLTEEGKLQAARVAILDSVNAAQKRLGEQSDGLDEKVAQLQAEWKNWYDELARNIATSPEVVGAFDSIKDAILDAFGGNSQQALETVVGWVNYLAEAAGTYGPIVIGWLADARDWVVRLYEKVTETWNALPDWFKTVAERSAMAAAGVYVADQAIGAANSTIADMIGTAGNLTTTLSGIPTAINNVTGAASGMWGVIKTFDFRTIADAKASFSLMAEAALGSIGPLTGVALASAAIFAAYEVGKTQPVSDFFQNLGLTVMGYSAEERAAMIETDHMTQAAVEQAKQMKAQEEAAARVKQVTDAVAEATKRATAGIHDNTGALDRNKLVLDQTKDEAKKYADALVEMNSAGTGLQGTLDSIDGEVVEAIKYYLEAGVAAEKLATAYGLTATQVKAVSEAFKDEQQNLKLEQKQLDDSIARWAEYYQGQAELSGSTTAKTIADIERWKAEQIKSHADAKTDTADFYDWLAAREAQMYEQSQQKRLEDDEHSRAHFEKIRDQAREYYEFVLEHTDQFTQEWIEQARQQYMATMNVADAMANGLASATDTATEKVRTLTGELIDAAEATKRLLQGGSSDVNFQNFNETLRRTITGYSPMGNPEFGLQGFEKSAFGLAKQGYSFDQIVFILTHPSEPKPPSPGPRIPGFRDGGYGDFGDGTLVELHGKEIITPIDKIGNVGGDINLVFHVNGTAQDVARQVSDQIMSTLKRHRQFGAA